MTKMTVYQSTSAANLLHGSSASSTRYLLSTFVMKCGFSVAVGKVALLTYASVRVCVTTHDDVDANTKDAVNRITISSSI